MPEFSYIFLTLSWILFYISTFYSVDFADLCSSSLLNRLESLKKLVKNDVSCIILDSRAFSTSYAIVNNNI